MKVKLKDKNNVIHSFASDKFDSIEQRIEFKENKGILVVTLTKNLGDTKLVYEENKSYFDNSGQCVLLEKKRKILNNI